VKKRSREIVFRQVSDLPCSPLSFFQKTLEIKKKGIPPQWQSRFKNKTAVLYFEEPSTRTRLSFEIAIQKLGMVPISMSSASSSFAKGETHTEFMRFIAQYHPEIVVFRTASPLLPMCRDIPLVINAGTGQSAHPTQALIDYVTILEHLGKASPLRIGFCGDVSRSRIFRSHIRLAQLMKDIQIGVYTPFPFGEITGAPDSIQRFRDKKSFFKFSEVICILRNQSERKGLYNYTCGAKDDFINFYRMHESDIPDHTFVLHPGPIHFETDMTHTPLYREKTLIDQQVENGLYTRICLLGILGEQTQ
jgi:aspartate carbamoyltransferase catalytic subunit